MADVDLRSVIRVVVDLSPKYNDEEACQRLSAAFRQLQEKVAPETSCKNEIASFSFLDSTFNVIQGISDNDNSTDEQYQCLVDALQMTTGLLTENRELQLQVWDRYQDKVMSCFRCDSPDVQYSAVILIYTVILNSPEKIVLDKFVFSKILNLIRSNSRFNISTRLIQLYIKNSRDIKEIYPSLSPDLRCALCNVIIDYIVDKDGSLGQEFVCLYSEKFLSYSENFVEELAKTEKTYELFESVKLLHLLSAIAGDESDLKVIQSDKTLLITCINLLKKIHSLSKVPGNNLTRIQKLSELDNEEILDSVEKSLSFGVKANIIRLIGNLCWKNEVNQNTVRELEAIPVLLDCCSIDGRNPLILQWTILAIRNLCDKNKENQKYIASIGKKGTVDANKMREIGFMLNGDNDGSSLSIAPLKIHD